jgi:hypothetical protein
MNAAVQYAFGDAGEAAAPGYSIRSGHESVQELYARLTLTDSRRANSYSKRVQIGGALE